MQVSNGRLNPAQAGVAAPATIAGSPAGGEDKAKRRERQEALLSAPGRFQQWGRLGQAQNRVAQLQAAEQSLSQVYLQLRTLAQRMHASAMSPEQQGRWGEQLARLSEQLQREGQLDARLQPRALEGDAARHRYLLDKVDLLGPRPVRERVSLLLAGQQQAMGITIAPGQRPADTLAQLNRHLAPLGIGAESEQGRVQLVAKGQADAVLRQPILMQGEGVRVPAGEPVLIKASPEPDALAPLAEAARKGELLSEREHLNRVMARIQDYAQRLQAQRQLILQQMADDWPAPAIEQRGDTAPLAGPASRFEQLVAALLAQANVSRHNAVALLRKE
ncbi:hypothetical protein [Zobellella iuensis]|uniref:hypothetical protein n=1 Tax=Zobellella iuensis TaxID=2803811 RepID=UPI001F398503|nr:hypothetical protein [Zobellella iuensis]